MKTTIFASAAASLLIAATPAMAETGHDWLSLERDSVNGTASVLIGMGDIDLTDPAGEAQLDERLRIASKVACSQVMSTDYVRSFPGYGSSCDEATYKSARSSARVLIGRAQRGEQVAALRIDTGKTDGRHE